VRMFRSFDPQLPPDPAPADLDVPDPYYGADDGFSEVLDIVERTCRGLLEELRALSL
jgi:protein-tyrosine phosphatase